jgi:hypothetical protein
MIADPTSYAIGDFVPFTGEVYLRLAERQNAALWPGQLLALALGGGSVILAWRGYGRLLAIAVSLAWVFVAVTFHLRLFAELTFAAHYIGVAFLVQPVFMVGCALLGGLKPTNCNNPWGPTSLGYGLVVVGLVVFPLLGPWLGRGWAGAGCFGILPDPTVLTTLGLLLIAARPVWLWLLLPIPLLWCALSGAIGWGTSLPLFWVLPTAGLLSVAGAIWKGARA